MKLSEVKKQLVAILGALEAIPKGATVLSASASLDGPSILVENVETWRGMGMQTRAIEPYYLGSDKTPTNFYRDQFMGVSVSICLLGGKTIEPPQTGGGD